MQQVCKVVMQCPSSFSCCMPCCSRAKTQKPYCVLVSVKTMFKHWKPCKLHILLYANMLQAKLMMQEPGPAHRIEGMHMQVLAAGPCSLVVSIQHLGHNAVLHDICWRLHCSTIASELFAVHQQHLHGAKKSLPLELSQARGAKISVTALSNLAQVHSKDQVREIRTSCSKE